MRSGLITLLAVMTILAVGASMAQADFLKSLKSTIDKAVAPSDSSSDNAMGDLGVSEITEGLKEALKVGTETVVGQIGAKGGYESDPKIHIPLPEKLQKVQNLMRQFGLSDMADEVETRLNKGAEAAAPKTKELIWKAISDMSLEDAKKIYDGPDDAATQYFRKVSTADLTETVRPIIDQSLKDVGAIAAYENLVGEFKKYPLVPDVKSDLTEHATGLALEGLFHYLAEEEAAIRNNPVKRTTEILQSVFGGR